jgi:hypothetical protein
VGKPVLQFFLDAVSSGLTWHQKIAIKTNKMEKKEEAYLFRVLIKFFWWSKMSTFSGICPTA